MNLWEMREEATEKEEEEEEKGGELCDEVM